MRTAQFVRGRIPPVQQDNCASLPFSSPISDEFAKARGFPTNPRRSLHWMEPVEVLLMESGEWFDYHYDNCCFLAARKKTQTIRHNVPAMKCLPELTCGHTHGEADWRPYMTASGRMFPSTEEAEYPASLVFTLAVVCSRLNAQVIGDLGSNGLPQHSDRMPWCRLPSR